MRSLAPVAAVVAHLCVAALFMPGRRSAYAVSLEQETPVQLKRIQRDGWYRTSHSAVGRRFVEVPQHLAASVKHMAAARGLHADRDDLLSSSSHFGRNVLRACFRVGLISRQELATDA
jgi:hypothetical protein